MTRLGKLASIIVLALMFTLDHSAAQERTNAYNQSVELGKVQWYRDYDQAVTAAEKEQKDIVILFQEVPGCSTCRNYGKNVLSHPLMVELLENSFIPLAIFNNKGGKDKKILEKFNEPSWNNPVVRIIDVTGDDLTRRIGQDYSAITLCNRMKEALELRGTNVPEYLNILEQELSSVNSSSIREDYFKMYCFWTGEKQLGKLDGVVDVESGFIGPSEVVKVTYDGAVIGGSQLDDYAGKQGFEKMDNSKNYRIASNDVHYYLLHSNYRYIPLSKVQKTKINSALGSEQQAEKYLSPQQKKWLDMVKTNSEKKRATLHDKDIKEAWAMMLAKA